MSSIRRKHVKVVGDQNRIGHRWHRLTDRSQSIASFGYEGLHHWVVGEGATAAQIVWFCWFYDEKKPKSGVLTMKNVDLTDEQWKMRLSNSMVCPDVRSISIGKMTINHAIFGGWTHFSYHLLEGELSTIRHLQLDTGLTGNLWYAIVIWIFFELGKPVPETHIAAAMPRCSAALCVAATLMRSLARHLTGTLKPRSTVLAPQRASESNPHGTILKATFGLPGDEKWSIKTCGHLEFEVWMYIEIIVNASPPSISESAVGKRETHWAKWVQLGFVENFRLISFKQLPSFTHRFFVSYQTRGFSMAVAAESPIGPDTWTGSKSPKSFGEVEVAVLQAWRHVVPWIMAVWLWHSSTTCWFSHGRGHGD